MKKGFKDSIKDSNPALSFISGSAPEQTQDGKTREIKSQRLNIVLKPSLKRSIEALAAINKTSVNGFICDALQQIADEHAEEINAYYEFLERLGK